MRKFLPYIFILSLVTQFLAPFSVARNFTVVKQYASAEREKKEDQGWTDTGYRTSFPNSKIEFKSSSYNATTGNSTLKIAVTVDTGLPESGDAYWHWIRMKGNFSGFSDESLILFVKEKDTNNVGYLLVGEEFFGEDINKRETSEKDKQLSVKKTSHISIEDLQPYPLSPSQSLTKIKPGSNYAIYLYYQAYYEAGKELEGDNFLGSLINLKNYKEIYYKLGTEIQVATAGPLKPDLTNEDAEDEGSIRGASRSMLPECSISPFSFSLGGCLAQGAYILFFQPTSWFFSLTGKLLDVSLMYSVSDTSYRSAFIADSWKTVRDICNIFFIFVLLFVAFKMILSMEDAKTKSLIVNVVIVGLIMNFSMFFAQVVIDASNIMARVFYNPKTMIIEKKGASPTDNGLGEYSEIKISEALVDGFDPAKIIMNVETVSQIGADTGRTKDDDEDGISWPTFLLISLLSTFVNITGIFVFLSLAIFLIARVVSLWLIIIFSPIAMLSYALPENIRKSLKDYGADGWWSKLISVSFMAPVLVFFLYIVLLFASKGLGIFEVLSGKATGLNYVITIALPFMIIVLLLKEAKSRAGEMSDKIGQEVAGSISKFGGMAAGVALGAATGGAAMLAKNTIGKYGSKIADSEYLQNKAANGGLVSGFIAKKAIGTGNALNKSSFDFRNTGVANSIGNKLKKETGIQLSGGPAMFSSKLGYGDRQKEKVKETEKEMEMFKMSDAEAVRQNKKASDWKKEYEKDLYEKMEQERKDVIARGGRWTAEEEKDFKDNHKTAYETANKKVKTADEIYRERVKDYHNKTKDGFLNNITNSKDTQTLIDKKMQDLSKDPDAPKPVTAKENYEANKKIDNFTKQQEDIERTAADTISKLEDRNNAIQDQILNTETEIQEGLNDTLGEMNALGMTVTNTQDVTKPENIREFKERQKTKNENLARTIQNTEFKMASQRNELQLLQAEIMKLEIKQRSGGLSAEETASLQGLTTMKTTKEGEINATQSDLITHNEEKAKIKESLDLLNSIIEKQTKVGDLKREKGMNEARIEKEKENKEFRKKSLQDKIDDATEIANKYRP